MKLTYRIPALLLALASTSFAQTVTTPSAIVSTPPAACSATPAFNPTPAIPATVTVCPLLPNTVAVAQDGSTIIDWAMNQPLIGQYCGDATHCTAPFMLSTPLIQIAPASPTMGGDPQPGATHTLYVVSQWVPSSITYAATASIVTVPIQAQASTAILPIGNSITAGGGVDTPNGNYLVGSYFVAPSSGNYVGTVHLYTASPGPATVQFGVYSTTGGSASGQPLLASGVVSIAGGAAGESTAPFTFNNAVAGATYFLAMSGSSNFQPWRIPATTATEGYAALPYTGSLPNPMVALTPASFLYTVSITNP